MIDTIYEDCDWTIEKSNDSIFISFFKSNHFVDDIQIKKEDFENGKMDLIKDILY